MSQPPAKSVYRSGIVSLAVCAGIACSMLFAALIGLGSLSWLAFFAVTAGIQSFLIATFAIIGESLIEDIVKSVLVLLAALFNLVILEVDAVPPLMFAVTAAATLATLTNSYLRRIERN